MAEPITSARSQAAMAISQSTHKHETHRAGVVVAARLRQVPTGDDAELESERLEQNRHQVGEQDDAEQRVAEARAAGQVGGPVARIHVANRNHVSRSGEGEHLAPERDSPRHGDRVVRLGETRHRARIAPSADGLDRRSGCGVHRRTPTAQSSTSARA